MDKGADKGDMLVGGKDRRHQGERVFREGKRKEWGGGKGKKGTFTLPYSTAERSETALFLLKARSRECPRQSVWELVQMQRSKEEVRRWEAAE